MGRTVAKEVTNCNDVRAAITAGGWNVIYRDLINEGDILIFIISIPIGTVGDWVAQQVQAQLIKFSQSLGDVSDNVVEQATNYLENLIKERGSGEADINGLGVKGGFATYNRHMEYFLWDRKVGSHDLPNNHQPYIVLRVTKPLPPKGHEPEVPPITAEAKDRPTPPGRNLGSRLKTNGQTMNEGDYLQSDNGFYRFICQGDGNAVMYGPQSTVVWQSHTDGRGYPPFRIVAQADGNVVQYDRNNTPLWKTGTATPQRDHSEFVFVLQDDRNLVLYNPADHWTALWSTRTAT